jgi:von Willebrand factor type A domain
VQYGEAIQDWELDLLGQTRKEYEDQIEHQKIRQERLVRFTQFMGRVNSAFTFRKVTVRVENSPIEAPAYSGASQVTFNSRLLGDLSTPKEIAGIKGLDLHEVSHILYTPREGSDIFEFVRENKLFMAYNALEDQRIETLFTSKYPSTIDWFTATILIHFVDNKKAFITSYPLLRGRRYLPTELRAKSRNAYPHQDQIDEISQIIDEYRLLIFPVDTEKGKDLIRRFNDLLPKDVGGHGGEGGEGEGEEGEQGTNTGRTINVRIKDPFGHSDRPHEGIESDVNSRPVNPKKQERDRKNAQDRDYEDDVDLANDLKDLDVEINPATGSDAGDEAGDEIDTMMSDLLDEILNDKDVASEINDILRQISGLPSLATNSSTEPAKAHYGSITPDANTFQASLAFGRELERIRADFDPAWEKYESQGRLHAHRYLRGDDLDTVFDRWIEGKDDVTEIECVILLDNSGSMSGSKATNSYRAMYAIKRAFDRINANCTVITFNDDVSTLYRASDKAGATIRDARTGGGTVPDKAIQYATKLLAETEKPIRIFFAITDGEWSGQTDLNHEAINRLSRAGVLTALAYIPDLNQQITQIDAHGCEIAKAIKNPLDLIGMARSITRYGIGRRLINN